MTLTEPPPAKLDLPDLAAIVARQRAHFHARGILPLAARRERLQRMHDLMEKERGAIRVAIQADYHRPDLEIDLAELGVTVFELRHAIRHLKSWAKPRRVGTPLSLFGTSSEVRCEPRGVCLIIAPWNYPIQLTLLPLISALAAGNCAVIKPSELTPNSSAWLRSFLGHLFSEEEVAVVEGDVDTSTRLLRERFDHIFFTGSPAVGRVVMRAAAEHLTPVTLELGGKSPVIVDETADIGAAAEFIIWGKCLNAGQTCIAPDYVLVAESRRDALLDAMKETLARFFGVTAEEQRRTPDYPRLVNARHFSRVQALLEDARTRGARVVTGGASDEAERFLSLAILTDIPDAAAVMHEEIFGPVLPVIPFRKLADALDFMRVRENPLSQYIFSRSRENVERILSGSIAGGTVVNDTLMHYMNPNLPFGGAGWSGLGRAHGEAGFHTFSNERSVMRRWFEPPIRRWMSPPYGERYKQLVDFMLKYL